MTENLKVYDGFKYSVLSGHFTGVHHDRMFDMASVEGRQGIGKTQYALQVLFGVYKDWQKALDHLYMEIGPALKFMMKHKNMTQKIPLIVFDDVGVHMGKYKMFQKGGFALIDQLNSVMDLAREATHGIMLTSPDEDVASFLRSKSWLLTQIKWMRKIGDIKLNRDQRVATTYRRKKRPDGKVFPKTICRDIYTINAIPSDILKQYYDYRSNVTDPVFNEALAAVEKDEATQHTETKDEWLTKLIFSLKTRGEGMTYIQIAKEIKAMNLGELSDEQVRRRYRKALSAAG